MSPSASGKKPSKFERSDWLTAESLRALKIIAGVAVGLVEVIFWIIYAARPNWGTYALVVGAPLVISFVAYRLKRGLVSESVLLAFNTFVVWFVGFTHPTVPALAVGVIMVILMLRNILEYARGTERESILETFQELEAPIKINDRLAIELRDDERYVFVTHPHIIDAVWWIVGMIAWLFVIVAIYVKSDLSFVGELVLLVVGELGLAIKPILIQHELLCLTNRKRFFIQTGIVKKSFSETSVDKITDQTVTITRVSTILAWLRIIKVPYGYYKGETAGQNQDKKKIENKIGPIPRIQAFKRAASTMMVATPPAPSGS